MPVETLETRTLLASIFAVTDSALPGEIVNVRGWDFGTAPQVYVNRVTSGTIDPTSGEIQASVLTKSDTNLTAMIPSTLDEGLYHIRVKNTNTGVFSSAFWINKPYAHTTEFKSVGTGHVFRLFGENLVTSEDDTTVTFNNISSSQSPITVSASDLDPYHVSITTPSGLIAGDTYELIVNNGFGGAWGDSVAIETIAAQASNADPFNLNVPWGSEFTTIANPANLYNVKTDPRLTLHAAGDGVTDDRAAINAAINVISAAGGGVLYLPAGTYRIPWSNGDALTWKSGVVFKGDGIDVTKLDFQSSGTYPTNSGRGIRATDVQRIGMMDLTYQNLSPTEIASISGAGTQSKYVFFKNFKHENPSHLDANDLVRMSHVLVEDSDLDGYVRTGYNGTNIVHVSEYVTFRRNVVVWSRGRLGYGLRHSVIENSTFTRDGDQPYAGGEGDGGWTVGGNSNLIFLGNTFNVIGAPITSTNDGESILAEDSRANPIRTASGGTSTTIEDSDAALPVPILAANGFGPTRVAIVSGKGAGQWRYIVSNTSTSITVDRPWDVIPDATSVYSTNRWNTDKWLIKDNTFEGVQRGIWLYTGANDTVITGNTLTDAEGIWVRGNSIYADRLDVAWDTLVENNTVRNTNNTLPAYIAIQGATGTGVYGDVLTNSGNVFRNNTVQGYALGNNNNSWNNGQNWFEGYAAIGNYTGIGSDTSNQHVGTVFQGNHAINTDRQYRVGTGSDQVVIWDATSLNAGDLVVDYTKDDQTHPATSVVWGSGTGAANPLPTRTFTSNNDLNGTTPAGGGVALATDGTSNTNYDISAGQGSLYNKASSAEFASIPLTGDFSIQTQIQGFGHSYGANTFGGLMVRPNTTDATAVFAAMYATPDNTIGYRFEYRSTADVYASKTTSSTITSYPNVWVKLTRVGNLITGYRSNDGTTWTSVGSVTIASLPSTVHVGLTANSGIYNRRTAAYFRNVSVTGSAPTVATAAAATPSPVTGTTTNVSVLGADNDGEATLTYTWSATGPAGVTFSASGTNAAKNGVATFSQAGNYTLTATITDATNQTVTSSVNVTVNQTLASLSISPSPVSVNNNATQQLTASALDQFGNAMTLPALTWSVTSGGGSVNSSGLYQAPTTEGSATVQVAAGAISDSVAVTIIKVTPPKPTNLAATALSSSQIQLTWTDNSNNEAGFKVEIATSATGPWTEIYRGTTPNQTSYTATGLSSSTTYYFRVRAYIPIVANSLFSNVASATTT